MNFVVMGCWFKIGVDFAANWISYELKTVKIKIDISVIFSMSFHVKGCWLRIGVDFVAISYELKTVKVEIAKFYTSDKNLCIKKPFALF